ncbi:transposable element Tc1 transposase [Trichonephila clavipes]|nr:transposable element Tc1 transposase [Trichonephila clavipes]
MGLMAKNTSHDVGRSGLGHIPIWSGRLNFKTRHSSSVSSAKTSKISFISPIACLKQSSTKMVTIISLMHGDLLSRGTDSLFELGSTSSTVEQLPPPCSKTGDEDIMLWRTFSWVTVGPLILVECTVKIADYLNIITNQLHLYIAFIFRTGNGIFQQDNVLGQKATIVLKDSREERKDEFKLKSSPPNLAYGI